MKYSKQISRTERGTETDQISCCQVIFRAGHPQECLFLWARVPVCVQKRQLRHQWLILSIRLPFFICMKSNDSIPWRLPLVHCRQQYLTVACICCKTIIITYTHTKTPSWRLLLLSVILCLRAHLSTVILVGRRPYVLTSKPKHFYLNYTHRDVCNSAALFYSGPWHI